MDNGQILGEIVDALSAELGAGYSSIEALVATQGKLLAKQAEDIAKSRISGSLQHDDELFDFFLDGLRTNSLNLAKAAVMLSALTLEKAWNAIAGILWGAIRTALTGAGVPATLLPATPLLHL